MLLIGPSLERSRYLTLATVPFVLLLATACRGLTRRAGIAAISLLVVFQATALQHDLRIWKTVSQARSDLCAHVAELARATPGKVEIDRLPLTLDGIYWRNGFEDCMELGFDIPMGKVRVNLPEEAGATLRLRWDGEARSLR